MVCAEQGWTKTDLSTSQCGEFGAFLVFLLVLLLCRCTSLPVLLSFCLIHAFSTGPFTVLSFLQRSPSEHSGGHPVYAIVHPQMRSTGWEDCFRDRLSFNYPATLGSHPQSSEKLPPFSEGGWRFERSYHHFRRVDDDMKGDITIFGGWMALWKELPQFLEGGSRYERSLPWLR